MFVLSLDASGASGRRADYRCARPIAAALANFAPETRGRDLGLLGPTVFGRMVPEMRLAPLRWLCAARLRRVCRTNPLALRNGGDLAALCVEDDVVEPKKKDDKPKLVLRRPLWNRRISRRL